MFAPMTKPKLTYFDAPVSRGEECRLALHIAGIDFEDDRIKGPDWPALKPKTPYGSMPVSRCRATRRSRTRTRSSPHRPAARPPSQGRLRGGAARGHDGARRGAAAPRRSDDAHKDEAEKKAAREAIAQTYLPTWAGFAEKQIGEGRSSAAPRSTSSISSSTWPCAGSAAAPSITCRARSSTVPEAAARSRRGRQRSARPGVARAALIREIFAVRLL